MTRTPDLFARCRDLTSRLTFHRVTGRVVEVTGLSVVAEGLSLPIGLLCRIDRNAGEPVAAQVVGIHGDRTVLFTLGEPLGVGRGDPVTSMTTLQYVPVGRQMLGCVLNGLGRPVAGRKDFVVEDHYPVFREAPHALQRQPVHQKLFTGVRALDALHTLGRGQRMGIFAGTGVGKSVLMGMIARFTAADVVVVALVGERGREVGEFLRKDLGENGLARSVVIASTSDESPVLRVRAGFTATAVAEYFRDQGNDVLLMMDSTTRLAMAQREIGLSAGEPPTTKGYPPSVFSMLPRLMERAGHTQNGTITGLYTVLVEGDDINEPISDAVRGILDGHVWLARELANRGQYPAISVLESISRVMHDMVDSEHRQAALCVRRVLADWADIEDLVNVGAYAPGANLNFDVAVSMKPAIDEFLRQSLDERSSGDDARRLLLRLADQIECKRAELAGQTREKESAQNQGPPMRKAS